MPLEPNRWTQIGYDNENGHFIVSLYGANPLPDGTGHYAAQLIERAFAPTRESAEALGAVMLKAAKGRQ